MSAPDSVRLAMPAEAVDVARLQRRSWAANPALAPAMRRMSADDTVRAWHEAIAKPPLAHCRVLVAQGIAQIVGFVVTGPSNDPDALPTDGMIAEFVVDKASADEGHSGRLINAAIDTLRADGFQTATIWVPSDDDAWRAFLVECGWGADGAHREVGVEDDEEVEGAAPVAGLKLIRLQTDITQD